MHRGRAIPSFLLWLWGSFLFLSLTLQAWAVFR
jgi:hypothetical protein